MVGTNATASKTVESVFFPTDFGKTSELIFHRVVELAKSLGAKLYVYHMVAKPFILPTGIIPPEEIPALLENEKKSLKKSSINTLISQSNQASTLKAYWKFLKLLRVKRFLLVLKLKVPALLRWRHKAEEYPRQSREAQHVKQSVPLLALYGFCMPRELRKSSRLP